MTDHTQLDADLAQFEATEASEADQLAKTQAANAALVQQHAQDQATIAQLQAELATHEHRTLFGTGTAGWVLAGETPLHAYQRITQAWTPKVIRVWGRIGARFGAPSYIDPTLPAVIEITSDAAGLAAGKYDAALAPLLAADPGRPVWLSAAHEPNVTPQQWATCQNHLGQLNHDNGHHYRTVPILEGGAFIDSRIGDWAKWWDSIDTSLVDAVGSDSYQHGKSDTDADTAAEVLQPVLDAAASLGLPVVFGELGARSILSDTARAKYLTDAVTLLDTPAVDAVCYFESDRGSTQLRPWCLLNEDGTARSPQAAAVWAKACTGA